jgi:primosomal protein N' (replication factor Y)
MAYAEVAVNSPAAQHQTFSYAIPPSIHVAAGQAVQVPFGPRLLQGIVIELTQHPKVEETREIASVTNDRPILSPSQIKLARWISEHYLAPLFESAALMLPPGVEQRFITFLHLHPDPPEVAPSSLTSEQKQVLYLLQPKEKIPLREVEKALGKKRAKSAVRQLLHKGLIRRSQELGKTKVKSKVVPYLRLAVKAEKAKKEAEHLVHRAPKQAALLRLLAGQTLPIPLAEIKKEIPSPSTAAKALKAKGLISIEPVPVLRNPLEQYALSTPLILTPAQEEALQRIKLALQQPKRDGATVFLLHGVTGSGKTEVYLQALAQAVSLGKRGIVLVPEIALTPQIIERFASRFPQRVAVLHSKLSLGEQFDEWHQIREGAFDVVIGSRGAIFSPQPDLGLIVIDEEHEWTYKQQEQLPHYHAREVALKLAELTGTVVILGSATPDTESYYRAQIGRYQLLQLPHRIAFRNEPSLPEVEIVDLRQELKTGNRSLFSRSLTKSIKEALAAGEQIILFLNRRGTHTFVQCRNCGFVPRCRGCDLPLTHHSTEGMLVCHQCNYRKRCIKICPECGSHRIKFLGIGTQKVEEEAARIFPEARVLRWDRDVTKGRYSHEHILKRLKAREADILIGTQMIAKGLDLPSVTLVGVISADTSLHFPDFRASERTFQLLSQVAGRAGRGTLPGRVIIQTYTPEHYAVAAAAKHDYPALYQREISYRRQYEYPPFTQLARLLYTHTSDALCQEEARRLAHLFREEIDSRGISNITLVGPSPAFFSKLRGKFRWQIVLRGSDLNRLLAEVPLPRGWVVDIDPISLL